MYNYLCVYIYIYIYYLFIFTHILTERERERGVLQAFRRDLMKTAKRFHRGLCGLMEVYTGSFLLFYSM